MSSIFGVVVGLLTAALSLLGFAQAHPELPQASRDQAQQVSTQATNDSNPHGTPATWMSECLGRGIDISETKQCPDGSYVGHTGPNCAFATCPGGSTVAVSGMSKYTDPDFGFSFWYPSNWTVASVAFRDDGVLSGGTMQKMLQISGKNRLGDFSAQLIEYSSPNKIVKVADGGAPMGHPHPAVNYYFDSRTHTWMMQYPNGYPSERGDGSYVYPIGYTGAADVSINTMGGLHMLSANWFVLIPLSAHNFLASDMLDANLGPLMNTIVATDPDVATPVSMAEQIKTIQSEKDAYAGQ